jgi:hypothetical protein
MSDLAELSRGEGGDPFTIEQLLDAGQAGLVTQQCGEYQHTIPLQKIKSASILDKYENNALGYICTS